MSRIPLLHGVRRTCGELPATACIGVSLAIERGEFVAIVGPSGPGKSILLNLIGTLDRLTSGTVEIDRIDVSQLSDRKLSVPRAHPIGLVFQQFHLSGGMNTIDSVADGLLYLRVPRAKRRQKAEATLIHIRLSHRLYHRPHQMSGGERQRATIARAVISNPSLLLTDEPTGNFNSMSGVSIAELLYELHEQDTTIVVITHGNDLALQPPRQIITEDGRIIHDSAAKEVAHVRAPHKCAFKTALV